ncbi:GGDEF domain-containing protein [Nitrosophilus kaiyonis]|uniref:GGDEF domain-containing protein n=1 Tax=Nitrosophilus kaiyonis TaxID=2930200 RepID=UPI002492E00A|nr:GGDEF domain-containing protein [Nitrosophilus kaiyonis]
MNLKKRLNIFLALFVTAIVLPTVIILIISFREYSIKNATDKANIVANMVKDGLTSHMENGIMDKRDIFLSKIKRIKSVKELKILRSKSLEKQFGKGIESFQKIDEIEKEVLNSGKKRDNIIETKDSVFLKVVIPYIASAYDIPNCLKCHQAKEGEVLGAISMKFDITDIRKNSIVTITKVIFLIFIVSLLGLLVVNFYTKKYVEFFENLKNILQKAYKGDYTGRLEIFKDGEILEVSKWVNALLEKIENSLNCIKRSVNYFINIKTKGVDPLFSIQELVNELAAVYKFKNIIEKDKDRFQIYDRVIELLQNKFDLHNFIFYEIDKQANIRKIYYKNIEDEICSNANEDINLCRAYRTGDIIASDKYLHICEAAKNSDKFYLCIPLNITDDFSIVISFVTSAKDEYKRIKNAINNFKNYLEVSKNVIETKILLEELKDMSLKDRMTGAYNRRYLDIFVKKNIPQALRTKIPYSVMMLDIDYFKMVNDKYGHDIGDKVIKELVNSIANNIRESDIVIRFGGEEFLVLLHNCNKDNAKKVAEKISKDFKSKTIEVGGEKFNKTVSIGISEFPKDTKQFWQAIKFADMALYKAKESGRDRIFMYDENLFEKKDNY